MNTGSLFVKVCGITRLQDAELAADLGASAIGFIFWPGSPRYIAPVDARAIVQNIPPGLKAAGVFVDAPVESVRQIADVVGLGLVQLHGGESSAYCRAVASQKVGVIKSIGMAGGTTVDVTGFDDEVLILLDAHDPERHGGTGRTIDWHAAQGVAASRRTILSGGLTQDNVRRAIAAVRPFGVDVASGVEASPGVKDPNRLRGFFEALHD